MTFVPSNTMKHIWFHKLSFTLSEFVLLLSDPINVTLVWFEGALKYSFPCIVFIRKRQGHIFQWYAIDTMPFIVLGALFFVEYMTQMSTTVRTQYLNSIHTKGLIQSCRYRSFHKPSKRWPSTSTLKFSFVRVQWIATSFAGIISIAWKMPIQFGWVGSFRLFLAKDSILVSG